MSSRLATFHTPVPYRRAFKPDCGCTPKVLKPSRGFHAMFTGQTLQALGNNHGIPSTRMPGLRPEKYTQRKALATGMPENGTILHLYAGKGNLARAVYKGKAKKHIIVDRHVNHRLKSELGGRVEIYEKNMNRFLEDDLPRLPDKFTLIDLDPFGTPGPAIQTLFKNYRFTQPTRIAVTDGYALHLGLGKNSPHAQSTVRHHYHSNHVGDGSRANQLRLLDNLMQDMSRRYGYSIRRVNHISNPMRTLYVGYLVKP